MQREARHQHRRVAALKGRTFLRFYRSPLIFLRHTSFAYDANISKLARD